MSVRRTPIQGKRDITKVWTFDIVALWCYDSHSFVAFSVFADTPIVAVSSSGGGLFGRPVIHNESGALLISGESFVEDSLTDLVTSLAPQEVASMDSTFPDRRLR